MGMALVTQHVMDTCQEDYDNIVLATEGTPDNSNKTGCFSYNGEWANVWQCFKRRLAFSASQ